MSTDLLTYRIESTAAEDGLMWRAVGVDSYGVVREHTRWTDSPAKATRDEQRLIRREYWCDDGGDPWREWVKAA